MGSEVLETDRRLAFEEKGMGLVRNTKLAAVVAALLLVATACGGQSAEEALLEEILENSGEDIGDIDINTDDGEFSINIEGEDGEDVNVSSSGSDDDVEITIEGEDGEVMTIGGGDIPDGLDLPIPDGGEVLTSITSGSDVLATISYEGDRFDELVAFYDAEINSDSDEISRNETSFTTEDGTFRSVNWADNDGTFFVSVADCTGIGGEIGAVCVTVNQIG